ncbi:nitrate ABC transporter permease [Sphingopyxis sp. H071]|nr:nitrate ABC transporter permease [Sphingopyxis sp. H057]KTE52726.1 nitrate ABC transporter permease [Sphingopyxis sp. H073]KTE54916.1 nitrate ABC transporter permease [Sphingopyxis sp. H071]KTE62376.1 nitrate ABC transporter permease [Sphingopyxis sp. H107]KTE65922.1 nitrate ABC transporter permease [Sphingopyxis sp. H100]KTE73475.1 nitrate ABC transporter permease [Sphingopyxis sp. H081]KTE80810.1 nitrate ABC transporter permease [Sphingopyxis sp. H067]
MSEMVAFHRRSLIVPLLVVAAVTALTLWSAFGGSAPRTVQSESARNVRFNMAWLPQGSMAGIFVAIDKGYFAEAGINVEPVRGFGGMRTANELDQGMFEFAYIDPLSVALNRSKGGKVRMIGGINMRLPAGACFVKERHRIERPADLAGLRFGAGQSSMIQALLPAWLKANGVDPARVERIQLDPAIVVSSLVEGRIDAAECWLGNSLALFDKAAKAKGVTIGRIGYADFGLDVYGSGFATRDALIEKDPELVRAFLKAAYRGYADAARDPKAALAIIRKAYPLLDEAVTERQIRETAELMTAEDGSLRLKPEKVERTVTYLQASGQLQGFDQAPQLFTNAFVPMGNQP